MAFDLIFHKRRTKNKNLAFYLVKHYTITYLKLHLIILILISGKHFIVAGSTSTFSEPCISYSELSHIELVQFGQFDDVKSFSLDLRTTA